MRSRGKRSLCLVLALLLALTLVPGMAGAGEANEDQNRLEVLILGQGSVEVAWEGETRAVEDSATLEMEPETEVSLEAQPEEGWVFLNWMGIGFEPKISQVMEEDVEILARFAEEKLALGPLDIAGQGDEARLEEGTEAGVTIPVESLAAEAKEVNLVLDILPEEGEAVVHEEKGPVEMAPGETAEFVFDEVVSGLAPGDYTVVAYGLDRDLEAAGQALDQGVSPFVSAYEMGQLEVTEVKEIPEEGGEEVIMNIDDVAYQVDGMEFELDVPPFIEDGRTFVPARHLAEAFGAEVDFGPAGTTVEWVTLEREGEIIEIWIGETELVLREGYLERGRIEMDEDEVARIVDGRTFLPFRRLAEAFGAEVDYETGPDTSRVSRVWFTREL